MLLCPVKGPRYVFRPQFFGSGMMFWRGVAGVCGQDREGPLRVEGKLL